MEASGVGSEDASVSHPDNPTPININTQVTTQPNQITWLRNNHINRRIQTKATLHTGTDEAAGAGKLSFPFFVLNYNPTNQTKRT
jgi:hypothetical protein